MNTAHTSFSELAALNVRFAGETVARMIDAGTKQAQAFGTHAKALAEATTEATGKAIGEAAKAAVDAREATCDAFPWLRGAARAK